MEVIKIVFLIALTMALSITLTMKTIQREETTTMQHSFLFNDASNELNMHENVLVPSKRVSRFLAEETKNPRAAADHCNKDNEVCYVAQGQNATTCCNNKCIDVREDKKNCGACKNKCKYTETCCRGGCVNINMDKRHCGRCNNRCPKGGYCVYGTCNYA